ncbi:hypothetical protein D3C72_2008690 [compost metagenome]
MRLEESSMRPMASTALRTISPERPALVFVSCTICRASLARSEAVRTVAVISSRAAAVSSSAAACCSVRRERLPVAPLISEALSLTTWPVLAMASIAPCNAPTARLKSMRSFS